MQWWIGKANIDNTTRIPTDIFKNVFLANVGTNVNVSRLLDRKGKLFYLA